MSIFSRIRDRIFGSSTAEAATPAGPAAGMPSLSPGAVPGGPAPEEAGRLGGAMAAPPAQSASPTPQVPSSQPAPVDVEAVLTGMAAQAGQRLDWRHSIVDLMKLLGLESSLEERRELARELGYTGSTSDSAAMNMWLHRQVMTKLAENGGRVPDELRN